MKKFLSIVIILFCGLSLFAQKEPLVKFYFQDGSTKQYNLSEIDSLGVIDKKNNYVMRIHYDNWFIAYYPTEIIGSIKFEKDSVKTDILNVYIFGYPKSYKLRSIDSLVFYIDQYQPLTIGSQVWMLKNLNVDHYRNGDSIPEVRNDSAWLNIKTGAWCYYNNSDSIGKIYGKLYNWYAVDDQRGQSPTGWHVPTDAEWIELEMYLGMTLTEAYGLGLRGTNEGGKLKEAGMSHWFSPNIAATNESGFSALPVDLGSLGDWWSSSEYDAWNAWFRGMYYGHATIDRLHFYKEIPKSVRCVKDTE